MKPAELSIAIDQTSVEATTAAFERLKGAIEAVNAELEKLGNAKHGGIIIDAVGEVVHCEVKPAPVEITGSAYTEVVLNPERVLS